MKFIILVSLILMLFCGNASAWYGDYDNRRAITVNNSNIAGLDYYSVYVNLSNTPTNETSLIIVNESAAQVVPHFCTNITGGNCYSLRFNCTHLPNDGILSDTYYIYYTNASASSTSNGTTTFMKYDSFEGANIDSSFWDVLIDGVITSSDQSVTGSKSAKFVLTTDTISGSLTHSDNIAIEYSLYTTTTGDYFMGRHGDGSKALNTYVYGSDIKYYTTFWTDTGGDIFNNAWGVIGWSDFNWSANTHDILYDNTVIAENVGFRTSYSSTNDEFLISTTSKTAYVDDFIVRKHYTTPSQASDWEVPGGYTCTGLSYDSTEDCLWNADFDNGTIVKIAKNGTKLGEINNININGIQGVAYDSSDNTLWASSYYDGKTYHIYKNGTYVGDNISIGRNGCSYEAATDSLWIMQEFNISRVDANTGIIQENITIAAGGDGLAYDAFDDTLWYSKDATTDTIRHIYASNGTEIGFFSSPATCPEGLTVDSSDGTIWHADDSEYHAGIPNGNRIYHLKKTGDAEYDEGNEPQATVGIEEIKSTTPIVTLHSSFPGCIFTNYTGVITGNYIVESNYPLNYSSLAFLMGVNYTPTSDMHSYLKVPSNTIASDGIYRAHNRNTTPYMTWENNTTITDNNVWQWSGGDNDSFWITKSQINDTHTWINMTGIASNVFPSMFYLGRQAMFSAPKTGIEINQHQGIIIKMFDLEGYRGRNNDYYVSMYPDTQLESTTPTENIDIWYCNDSLDPLVDDPTTCPCCVRMDTWASSRWMDHEAWQPHNNVSYAKPLVAYAGTHPEILPDEVVYLYFTSNTLTSKSYILNATNHDPGICNITYAQTNTMWTYNELSDTSTAIAYTPSFYATFVRDYEEFLHHLYIANDQGVWGHSNIYNISIGVSDVPPTYCVYNYFWQDNTTDYNMNGSYSESFWVNLTYGFDPDNGAALTHVLSLYDVDYNFVAFVNDSLTGNATDADIFVDISYYNPGEYMFKIVSTDNEGSTSVTWSKEFTLSDKNSFWQSIKIIQGFPTAIGNILSTFLSFLPLFVGILISGFILIISVSVFSKFKKW